MTEDFKKELASLLNRYSWDNACETPDHILADYVERCLTNLCGTINQDIAWHENWKRLGEAKRLYDDIDNHLQKRTRYRVVWKNAQTLRNARENLEFVILCLDKLDTKEE